MAAIVLTSATVLAGGAWTGTAPGAPGTQTVSGTITTSIDLSPFCTSVTINTTMALQEITNFASGGYTGQAAGLKSASVAFNFNQDFAVTTGLDYLINTTLSGLGDFFYCDIKPTSSARGTSNPSYVFELILAEYMPIVGNVGDKATVGVTFPVNFAWARLTS
jgi:hypothetical protein